MNEQAKPRSALQRWALGSIVAAALLTLLIVGRAFLVPLVLALLVASIISALIERIQRMPKIGKRMPNWLASVLALLGLVLVLLVLYSLMAEQAEMLMFEGPAFVQQVQSALLQIAGAVSEDLQEALEAAFASLDVAPWFRLAASSLGGVLVTVVLVTIYVGFLLAERPYMAQKVEQLFPDAQQHARVQANIQTVRSKVHHYLVLKTLISAGTGLAIYVVAWCFGLQFALLLGLMTFLLNFIPSVGSIIATALPVLVALVQFDGLAMVLLVLAVVGTVQFVLGNVLDPMLTGKSLQMSSLAIIVSLTFWSAVWGVVGMFLAVPLMVIVMIICAQIPALRPVAVMLSKSGCLDGVTVTATDRENGLVRVPESP